ncbi:hypothetical protein Tco_0744924 [Tanacetum coccineum]
MAEEQAIVHAPQWENMTVDNVTFQTNNVIGNFNYPPNVLAYKPIMKFLLNCPLNKAFTNCFSVLYQNYLREFWSTTVAYDPSPSTDETEQRPLSEFLIKFSVLIGQRPLTLDFNTFCSSTSLDYNNGKYVAHPTPEVLGGNYSSTKQVNSIQQLLTYCLITRTDVDIGEIIYNDLGPKASESLLQKRKKPQSKKTPKETKATSHPKPTKDSEQSHSVSSGTVPDPRDLERNIQLARPLGDKDLEGNKTPVDMEPINPTVVDPSGTSAKYQVDQTQSTRLRYQSLTKNEGEPSYEGEPDAQPLVLSTCVDVRAFLLSNDEAQESKEDILGAESDTDSSSDDILKKHDNTLPLTERQLAHALKQEEELAAWAKSSTNMAWNLGSRLSGLE